MLLYHWSGKKSTEPINVNNTPIDITLCQCWLWLTDWLILIYGLINSQRSVEKIGQNVDDKDDEKEGGDDDDNDDDNDDDDDDEEEEDEGSEEEESSKADSDDEDKERRHRQQPQGNTLLTTTQRKRQTQQQPQPQQQYYHAAGGGVASSDDSAGLGSDNNGGRILTHTHASPTQTEMNSISRVISISDHVFTSTLASLTDVSIAISTKTKPCDLSTVPT